MIVDVDTMETTSAISVVYIQYCSILAYLYCTPHALEIDEVENSTNATATGSSRRSSPIGGPGT